MVKINGVKVIFCTLTIEISGSFLIGAPNGIVEQSTFILAKYSRVYMEFGIHKPHCLWQCAKCYSFILIM